MYTFKVAIVSDNIVRKLTVIAVDPYNATTIVLVTQELKATDSISVTVADFKISRYEISKNYLSAVDLSN